AALSPPFCDAVELSFGRTVCETATEGEAADAVTGTAAETVAAFAVGLPALAGPCGCAICCNTEPTNATLAPPVASTTRATPTFFAAAVLTTCRRFADLLVVKFLSALYRAVIVWVATVSDDVLNVATPPPSVPEPIGVPPSRNVTVPLGVPVPGDFAATVAVKVTLWPKTDGFDDDVS